MEVRASLGAGHVNDDIVAELHTKLEALQQELVQQVERNTELEHLVEALLERLSPARHQPVTLPCAADKQEGIELDMSEEMTCHTCIHSHISDKPGDIAGETAEEMGEEMTAKCDGMCQTAKCDGMCQTAELLRHQLQVSLHLGVSCVYSHLCSVVFTRMFLCLLACVQRLVACFVLRVMSHVASHYRLILHHTVASMPSIHSSLIYPVVSHLSIPYS